MGAIDILYKTNTFDFDSMETLIVFFTTVPPHRFNTIQKLQLDFRFHLSVNLKEKTPLDDFERWQRTWNIIAGMEALRHLWVSISWPLVLIAADEARFIGELAQVKGLRHFEVSLSPVRGSDWERFEGEFTIIRKQ